MKKILVTGANGFLGKKICKIFAQKGFEVIRTDNFAQSNQLALDATKKEKVSELIKAQKPFAVIHCAAITDVDWCEENRGKTFEVNVVGTENVSIACRETGAKMVLISTDYIFDGKKSSKYKETDKPNPLSIYAESKLEAEKIVEKETGDFLILRTSSIYGFNDKSDKQTFPKFVIENLSKGKEITCFTDQSSNPALTDDVALALAALLEKKQKGIFHATGLENLTRLEFAKKTAKAFCLDQSLIKPGTWAQAGHKAMRPKKLNMDISKLNSLGINMSDAMHGLLKMKAQMQVN